MLPERGEEVRSLLRKYVDVRLEVVRTGKLEGIRVSEDIQQQLWTHAVVLARNSPNLFVSLFVQSLNEVIDLHAKRIQAGLRSRIPGTIWLALFAITVLSFAGLGYQAGLAGTSRSLAILAVAFAFSAVIWLIADLDRPQEGTLKVSQQAMIGPAAVNDCAGKGTMDCPPTGKAFRLMQRRKQLIRRKKIISAYRIYGLAGNGNGYPSVPAL